MSPTPPRTTLDLLRLRAEDDHAGLLFEDSSWSWREFVQESAVRAHFLIEQRDADRPFHVGVMLENVPEYMFLIAAAAMSGATVVGVNLTRRGEELAEDIRFTDCQMLITDSALAGHLDGLDVGTDRIWLIDSPEYTAQMGRLAGSAIPDVPAANDPATQMLLLFTSGSTGRPKAVVCSTGRFAAIAAVRHMGLGRDDVSYNSMPLFHGNALMACWANPLITGGSYALARKFSASRFVDDLIKFKATYFNYVGRSLAYVLAQPERPEERRTRLRACFGTEASAHDRNEFERRFGIVPTESYGSSEGAVVLDWRPGDPPDALGRPRPSMPVAVLNPETLEECPVARFDEHGRLLNAEEAIGELTGIGTAAFFEGYYKNPDALRDRIRGANYHTGDLGYRDENGYFYFAGRGGDWLRVDSENFAAAPVERILSRYPDVHLVAVYPVPDSRTGDQVMATMQFEKVSQFDPVCFATFLSEQADLGTKWAPKYVRVTTDVPTTATRKIDKPRLRRDGWRVSDPVYFRPTAALEYRLLDDAERGRITAEFEQNRRLNFLR